MEVVLRCKNDACVGAVLVNFTMLLIFCGLSSISPLVSRGCYYRLAFHCWLLIYQQFELSR